MACLRHVMRRVKFRKFSVAVGQETGSEIKTDSPHRYRNRGRRSPPELCTRHRRTLSPRSRTNKTDSLGQRQSGRRWRPGLCRPAPGGAGRWWRGRRRRGRRMTARWAMCLQSVGESREEEVRLTFDTTRGCDGINAGRICGQRIRKRLRLRCIQRRRPWSARRIRRWRRRGWRPGSVGLRRRTGWRRK